MITNSLLRKWPIRLIGITVAVTVLVTLGITYLSGHLSSRDALIHDHAVTAETDDTASGEQLYTCGMHPWIISKEPGNCPICGMKLTPKHDTDDTNSDQSSGDRKIAYWRAPMNPTEIYDKPGKSAMGMNLVPVYEDEVVGGVSVKIDPVIQQNMGIRTQKVVKGSLTHSIRTYGHVTYDETRMTIVSPKYSGWIEKLYVDFTGQFVQKGQPLFDIYSPELLTVQEEYLGAYRSFAKSGVESGRSRTKGSGVDLLSSARRRFEYFGISEEEIRALEKSGKVRKSLTVNSPYTGVVILKNAIEGGFIKAGTEIYEIADLSRVWVDAHIYEYELPWVANRQEAELSFPYFPGKVIKGKVAYMYPYLQQKTRDVVIRLEFDNPGLALKPDMYADVKIKTGAKGKGLIIPAEAVIRSGERNVVFVSRGDGKFDPRNVTLGLSLDGGNVQVLSGLAENDVVVCSGQFLLDSESKLKEAVRKMLEAKTDRPKTDQQPAEGEDDNFFDDVD